MSDLSEQTLSPRDLGHQAVRSATALMVRQVVVQGLNVVGGILLARLLTPTEFGLYAIVTFLLTFLAAFGGTGLAASLIRQPNEPVELEYRSVYTIQQVIVIALVLVLWMAAPWIAHAYRLPPDNAWIFRLVALSLLATSFMVIPQVRLERHLAFDKLALVEIAQAFTYNVTAVFLAWWGLGPLSFAIALLLRSITGAILANWISPWKIGWSWDWNTARKHLEFGLFLQGGQVVSLIKDSITPVFVGLYLGAESVGYINWAQMVANYTVMALMVFQRLYMPMFARLQQDRVLLARFVERVLLVTNAITAPVSVLTLVLIEPITRLIFGEKWLVALPIFYLLVLANLVVASSTPLQGLLNALGQSQTTFAFTLLWAGITWVLGLPFVYWFGDIGFAITNVVVQVTNLWLFAIVRKQLPICIWGPVLSTWATSLLVGVIVWLLAQLATVPNLYILVGFFLLGLLLFGVIFAQRHKTTVRELYWAWKVR
ncbi:Teichuronic acid biosynthesis protein TuaB [Meiothermus luteus]|uniref:Teichuronic acid biosynthesis protein TuaB n=1 Tax=Meiothermus luteus TaxID=2026184 RepID=A0A399EGQ8_9DEIN|nr:oligosaccharide flippase family protein [Meiothermus luteus]RIH83315.1 Teichuronic acid biosynthesis protein TuaB [Meiothermus luteus]